jgi:hypothetical protein
MYASLWPYSGVKQVCWLGGVRWAARMSRGISTFNNLCSAGILKNHETLSGTTARTCPPPDATLDPVNISS